MIVSGCETFLRCTVSEANGAPQDGYTVRGNVSQSENAINKGHISKIFTMN